MSAPVRLAETTSPLGADHVVDYTSDDFADGGNRYELVPHIAGNPTASRLRGALTRTGTAVVTGGGEGGSFSGGMNFQLRAIALSPLLRQRLTTATAKQRYRDIERLTAFIETGQALPSVDRPSPLHEAADAMRHPQAGDVRGKVAFHI